MNNKPTITYIKFGKEYTIKHLLKQKLKKELCTTAYQYNNLKKELIINAGIDFIHFKNVKFSSEKILGLRWENRYIQIILEDCYFDTNELSLQYYGYGIDDKSSVQLINPIFIKETYVDIKYLNDIDITLSNEGESILI